MAQMESVWVTYDYAKTKQIEQVDTAMQTTLSITTRSDEARSLSLGATRLLSKVVLPKAKTTATSSSSAYGSLQVGALITTTKGKTAGAKDKPVLAKILKGL